VSVTYTIESRTTRETANERVKELAHVIGYLGGVAGQGAAALAQFICGLEIRITELEERLAVQECMAKSSSGDPLELRHRP
jgi:hypothetical protein